MAGNGTDQIGEHLGILECSDASIEMPCVFASDRFHIGSRKGMRGWNLRKAWGSMVSAKCEKSRCPVIGALVAAARDDQVRVLVDDIVESSRCLTRRRLLHAPV